MKKFEWLMFNDIRISLNVTIEKYCNVVVFFLNLET